MKSIVILTCLYDDWKCATELFGSLGEELARRRWPVELVVVDDGSLERRPPDFLKDTAGFSRIEVVTLKRNMGHQRAIAVGLLHIFETKSAEGIAIMDSDGQDEPDDLIRLIESFAGQEEPRVIFAARTRRSESAVFRLGYLFYRALHFVLTGFGIRFGNFSLVPRPLLERLVVDPNLWLHFAATVVASRIPYTTIPTRRGKRLHGDSKLNLVSLVIHGIAAISCYNEIVGVRLIFCSMGLSSLLALLIVALIILRLALPWTMPAWTTYAAGLLVILLVEIFLMVLALAVLAISNRKAHSFVPIQQYKILIRGVEIIR